MQWSNETANILKGVHRSWKSSLKKARTIQLTIARLFIGDIVTYLFEKKYTYVFKLAFKQACVAKASK